MTIKDVILIILSYCGLKFVDKLIEDNLPNLHYKNIIKFYYNYVVPLILTCYMGIIYLQLKISTDKQVQKNLENVLILIAAAIILEKPRKLTPSPRGKLIPLRHSKLTP
jgi:hypothetical protein